MAQLVDAYGLGPYSVRIEGSSPSLPTTCTGFPQGIRGSNPLGGKYGRASAGFRTMCSQERESSSLPSGTSKEFASLKGSPPLRSGGQTFPQNAFAQSLEYPTNTELNGFFKAKMRDALRACDIHYRF